MQGGINCTCFKANKKLDRENEKQKQTMGEGHEGNTFNTDKTYKKSQT